MIKLETISFKGPNSLLLLFSFFLCVQLCMRACAYHVYIIYDDISYIHLFKKIKLKKKKEGGCVGLLGDFHFFI